MSDQSSRQSKRAVALTELDHDGLAQAADVAMAERDAAVGVLERVQNERDRYREALSAIVYLAGDSQEKGRIAREALEGGQA